LYHVSVFKLGFLQGDWILKNGPIVEKALLGSWNSQLPLYLGFESPDSQFYGQSHF
jgi:hypothetical protein